MFQKRSKKALSHVDWAISLGIFLLYLVWFFIFIKPLFAPSENVDTLLDMLESGLEDEIMQDVDMVRVFIPDDVGRQDVPIIIPFIYDWDQDRISISADHFYIDAGKMFFLANLSDTKYYDIYHPHDALAFTPPPVVIANDERTYYGDFSAHFAESVLDYIIYEGDDRLWDFEVEVDGDILSGEGLFDNGTLVARYRSVGDDVNLTHYTIARNSHIYSYIEPSDRQNHTVQISFSTFNYTYYYLSPLSAGEIRYSIGPNCYTYTDDFLDLYTASSGLLITTDDDVKIRLCSNQTTPTVTLTFDLTDEVNFNIYIHDGPVSEVVEYPIDPIVGVTETLKTVSKEKISYLRNRDYDYLKYLFRFPKDSNFNVTVDSGPISASYGMPHPVAEDIYARKVEGFLLDDDFSQKRVVMTLTVW